MCIATGRRWLSYFFLSSMYGLFLMSVVSVRDVVSVFAAATCRLLHCDVWVNVSKCHAHAHLCQRFSMHAGFVVNGKYWMVSHQL